MNTKLLYLILPMAFSGCFAALSVEGTPERSNQEELNRQFLDAAKESSFDEMTALLKKGADINARNTFGKKTALHWAVVYGDYDCLKFLINANANINACDIAHSTPLHRAAGTGNIKAVKALIAAKADINARNQKDGTPLHEAACGGNADCIKALIEAGAEYTALKDGFGHTALGWASAQDQNDCLKLLVKYSYLLAPSAEALSQARKRTFGVLLFFLRLSKSHKEGGQGYSDLKNRSLQFQIISSNKELQEDLVLILLDDLKKGREIKPGLLSRSKEAAVSYLLKKLDEIISSMDQASMKPINKDFLDRTRLEENLGALVAEGINERCAELKGKK